MDFVSMFMRDTGLYISYSVFGFESGNAVLVKWIEKWPHFIFWKRLCMAGIIFFSLNVW
jgi:hypothetical protein